MGQQCLVVGTLLGWVMGSASAAGPVLINEFMAANSSVITDPQGHYDDWIELYNGTRSAIDVGGLYLSDDPDNPTQWRIPEDSPGATTIPALGYLLIWADGDIDDEGLHAAFRLRARGEHLCLYDGDGVTLWDSIEFADQEVDVSQGRFPDGAEMWGPMHDTPTPGGPNVRPTVDAVSKPLFSHERGFYDKPMTVTLASDDPEATVYYTLDGREPFDQEGGRQRGQVYTGPLVISRTTTLRAKAVRGGDARLASDVVTHTYLFLEDVLRQAARPAGFPTNWGHAGADYQMDPRVVDAPEYRDAMLDSLRAIPSLSLVMSRDDWFGGGGRGIYIQGQNDERAVSAEYLLPDGSPGFQIDCTVMIVGGSSPQRWKMDKLSMRLKFRGEYGPSKLRYPLFGEDATEVFDTLVVDARMNNTWAYGGGVSPSSQRAAGQYTRDQFACDIQNSMGGYAPRGRKVHLYLNGLYWGLYWLHERPDEHFAAAALGGRDGDYDVLKHNAGRVVSGSSAGYQAMLALADAGLTVPENYRRLEEVLDVPGLIDYLIMNYYLGNWDWAHHNWYASRNRQDPKGRWRYHSWDAEHIMEGLFDDVTNKNSHGGPTGLHRRLLQSDTYRLKFADQVHRHLFNQGILTPEPVIALYQVRLDEVYEAVLAESARWGDNHRTAPYTRDIDWVRHRDWLINEYFPRRADIVLDQFVQRGWYPEIEAPSYLVNGLYQHGGYVETGAVLSMVTSEADGDIYYSRDGSDPQPSASSLAPMLVLAAADAPRRYWVPSGAVDPDWASAGFDDSGWSEGRGGIGFELGWDYQRFINVDLLDVMWGLNASCLIRIPFHVDDPAAIGKLTLKLRYDDGFIAYVNGVKAAAEGAPDDPSWHAGATHAHEAAEAFTPIDLSHAIPALTPGENILAVHGLNASITSPDFLIGAELLAEEARSGGVGLYSGPLTLSKSGYVNARLFKDERPSALNETLYAVGPVKESLRISELMYHPPDANDEFVELVNIGPEPINLNLVQFTNGIRFRFGDVDLVPGAQLLLVRDRGASVAATSVGIPVFGPYEGNLSNGGERIRLADALGSTILDFRYEDNWHDGTDGDGLSLEVVDVVSANPEGYGRQETWRPSLKMGGTPGR